MINLEIKNPLFLVFISIFIILTSANILAEDIESQILKQGLVDVTTLDNTLNVDLKYSTLHNFLRQDAYGDLEKCYLQSEPAKMLAAAQKYLRELKPGYSLMLFDCVRPRSVQRKMWNIVKGTKIQKYVANPDSGSIHNYGAAVDLTIIDEYGKELDMGTPFDYFGKRAQPKLEKFFLKSGKLTKKQFANRKLLRKVMKTAGFHPLNIEWWHFNAFPVKEVKSRYKIIE